MRGRTNMRPRASGEGSLLLWFCAIWSQPLSAWRIHWSCLSNPHGTFKYGYMDAKENRRLILPSNRFLLIWVCHSLTHLDLALLIYEEEGYCKNIISCRVYLQILFILSLGGDYSESEKSKTNLSSLVRLRILSPFNSILFNFQFLVKSIASVKRHFPFS